MVKLPIHKKGSRKGLVVYIPGGIYQGSQGRIYGPNTGWLDSRDLELLNRINKFGFDVSSFSYTIRSGYNSKEGMYIPKNWIQTVYDFAEKEGFTDLHLIGFSGGGSVISSQVLYYPNILVKNLIIISGMVAVSKTAVHGNAAFYANQIKVPTLLIYGSHDKLRSHATTWVNMNPQTDFREYVGNHNFEIAFEQVMKWIAERLYSPGLPPAKRNIKLEIRVNDADWTLWRLKEDEVQRITIDVKSEIL